MIVKVCGITRSVDAAAAAAAGADAVGFVLAPSPRRIDLARLRTIDRSITGVCRRVGVFVDAPLDEVRQAIGAADLDIVQLHGGETPADCARIAELGVDVWKRLDVRGDDTAERLAARGARYAVAALLVDPGSGEGRTFDWSLTKRLHGAVVVAGGLSPGNVADAVRAARPWGVDVSSGVETEPGVKDAGKIRAFVAAARMRPSFARSYGGQEGRE